MGTPYEEFLKGKIKDHQFLHKTLAMEKGEEIKEKMLDRGWCKRAGIESEYSQEEIDRLKEEMLEEGLERYFEQREVKEDLKEYFRRNAESFVTAWSRVWFNLGERWWYIQDVPTIFDDVTKLEDLPARLRSKAAAVQRLRRSQIR